MNQTATGISLQEFLRVNSSFPKTEEIDHFKQSGGKVFGWLCSYVPEELLHAAGVMPVRVTGGPGEQEMADANAYFSSVSCSFSRSCFQMGIEGDYTLLDGFVAGSTCDGARRLFDHWQRHLDTPFTRILSVPRKNSPSTLELYYQELVSLKTDLENYLGRSVTDGALRNSIGVYETSRKAMAELYELRKTESPPLTGAQTLEIMNASSRMGPETFSSMMGQLLPQLKKAAGPPDNRARIMLVGSILNNSQFVESIEDLGAVVVTDALCNGTRSFYNRVALEENEPPLHAIARRYLSGYPCARMFPSSERLGLITEQIGQYRVEGVISQNIRYCAHNSHDLPALREELGRMGIPLLSLDIEYGSPGSGQVHTRVQAFLEMIHVNRQRAGRYEHAN